MNNEPSTANHARQAAIFWAQYGSHLETLVYVINQDNLVYVINQDNLIILVADNGISWAVKEYDRALEIDAIIEQNARNMR